MRTAALLAAVTAAVAAPTAAAVAGSAPLTGHWHHLPAAPIALTTGVSATWTGSSMFVFGREQTGAVAATYDPRTDRWSRLRTPPVSGVPLGTTSVWTGKEVVVLGQGVRLAFTPATGRWRTLPSSPLLAVHGGFKIVAWTGREVIGWGGGCCGDAFSDGVAFNPSTGVWRALPASPLTPGGTTGAWTGRELVVFSRDLDPDGKRYPARLARAAAYDPATNTWRRIPTPPATNGSAVFTGGDLLLVAAGRDGRSLYSWTPGTGRWLTLAQLPSARFGSAAAWTGTTLLLWGGYDRDGTAHIPPHGLAFDPLSGAWSALPTAPLAGRYGPVGVWTGHSLVIWGGTNPAKAPGTDTISYSDGAMFTPHESAADVMQYGCGDGM